MIRLISLIVICLVFLPGVLGAVGISPQTVSVNSAVNISIRPAVEGTSLVIVGPTSVFRYLDEIETSVTFVPREAGAYLVQVLQAGNIVESLAFVAADTAEEKMPDVSDGDSLAEIQEIGEPFSVPRNKSSIGIKTSDDELVNAGMRVYKKGLLVSDSATSVFDRETIGNGTYDIVLELHGNSIRSLRLQELEYVGDIDLGIDEVPISLLKGDVRSDAVHAFAVDPAALEFEEGSLTFVAVGNALYKCASYDFLSHACAENVKVMDIVPGRAYTIPLSPSDPLFTQTGYLSNPSFTGSTVGWVTLDEGPTSPSFAHVASDTPQTGIAEIRLSGSRKVGTGNYHQGFNLTIPPGTELAGINFTISWRVSDFSDPGSVNFLIQDAARTQTYCSLNTSFSGSTSWRSDTISTDAGCALSNFFPGTNYTFRVRCNLDTAQGGQATEACLWDDAQVLVMYNDTTAPSIHLVSDSPDPVTAGSAINITVNVTDNIAISAVVVEVDGTNSTMEKGDGDIYYYDNHDTNVAAGTYSYAIHVNDTSDNAATSSGHAFQITETDPPLVELISPAGDSYVAGAVFTVTYNVSDASAVDNCSLYVNGGVANTTVNPAKDTPLQIAGTLQEDGQYSYYVQCVDSSSNAGSSPGQNVTRDSLLPVVFLETADNVITGTAHQFSYTPVDANLANCSLYGNWSGAWQEEQTETAPIESSANVFLPETLSYGANTWNVLCYDSAGNAAFNATNRTIIYDDRPPLWSGETAFPSNGTAYFQGESYRFNVTWSDEVAGIAAVALETNASGTLQNVTPTQDGQTYMYTFVDLAAGTYALTWYATDTAGNANQTAVIAYAIGKAAASVNLAINGTDGDLVVPKDALVNSSAQTVAPAFGYLELYLDGVLVGSGQGGAENLTALVEERRYNFTAIVPETQNYTEARETHFVDVIDTIPPQVVLGDPENGSLLQGSVAFFFTPTDNVDIGNCSLILDGQLNETKDVPDGIESNISVSGIAEGPHTWTVNCSDLANNTAENLTGKSFIVDTQAPAAFNLLTPTSGTAASQLSPTFSWTQATDANFENYTLLIDNDIGFGSVNYVTATYQEESTSVQQPVGDQTTWYWKILAYDAAGNAQESGQTYTYTADAIVPDIALQSPADGAYVNTGFVNLTYSVSDFAGIVACSLYVGGVLNQTNTSIQKAMPNTFVIGLSETSYLWSASCTDEAGNIGSSVNNTLTVDVSPPTPFSLSTPLNDTVIAGSTPTYSWSASSDANFENYTVEVSDSESFSHVNVTLLATESPANTSASQAVPLADGAWHWRVTAYDTAGNSLTTVQRQFTVDTQPPATFDLLAPGNGTQDTNASPMFSWEQTTDANFENYTLLFADSPSFSYVNFTTGTFAVTENFTSVAMPPDVFWYWRVIAYDGAGLQRNSSSSFVYLADNSQPVVSSVSPANGATITASSLVQFQFNIADTGDIDICTLYLDGAPSGILNNPAKGATQTIPETVENGNHAWYVNCTDQAGNNGVGAARNLTVNVQVPTQALYQSTPGSQTFTSAQQINFTYSPDNTESSVGFDVAPASAAAAVNATHVFGGEGLLIQNNTIVNFSGWFAQGSPNVFYVTWKLYALNGTSRLVCQSGDDGAGGTPIGDKSKKQLGGSCINTGGAVRLRNGGALSLVVDMYNSAGNARSFTHYWEDLSESFTQFEGYALGTLSAALNSSPLAVPEGTSYVEQCAVSCAGGDCLNTNVYVESHNGTAWERVGSSGNVTLNTSQTNPVSLGLVNGTLQVNFSLYGNTYSDGNTLRCFATSDYSNATSSSRTVSVVDVIPPSVTLVLPGGDAAISPQNVTFRHVPVDSHLANCSLYGNWSGTWQEEQFGAVVESGGENLFSPVFLDYGAYAWNVLCTDESGNSAFSPANRTLLVAGDVAVSGIVFSSQSPVEGELIEITANITNNANRTEENVTVQFWLNSFAGQQIGGNQSVRLAPLGSNVTSVMWNVEIGSNDILAVADPPNGSGSLVESDEGNNVQGAAVITSIWQTYYGNTTGNITLDAEGNMTFLQRLVLSPGGNIYVSDTDTSGGIQFEFLAAIGRNTTAGRTAETDDDFQEIDTLLNTSAFVDSVNSTYTENGLPKDTVSLLLFGQNVAHIPVVNSTNTTTFTTGILWDVDDSTGPYFDATDSEDLIFVTAVRNITVGAYGMVNFEIRVPSRLTTYKGTADTVTFYVEIA